MNTLIDLEDFVVRHPAVLLELMDLPHTRLPSYSTIRRVMVRIDFRAFAQVFNGWVTATSLIQRPATRFDGLLLSRKV